MALSILTVSASAGSAFADDDSELVVSVDEGLSLVVAVDEGGSLGLRGLEVDGAVVPVSEDFVETESMLSALQWMVQVEHGELVLLRQR